VSVYAIGIASVKKFGEPSRQRRDRFNSCSFAATVKQKPPLSGGFCFTILVEMVQKSWNQLEKYVFETYELLSGKKKLNDKLEIVGAHST
jgi:hypothetical protein